MFRARYLALALLAFPAWAIEVRPTIEGSLTQSCIDGLNCAWTTDMGGCSSVSDGQLEVRSDYVRVDGLRIAYSKCRGVKVKEGTATFSDAQYGFRFENSVTYNTAQHPLVIELGSHDWVIRDNSFSYYNMCENSERNGGTTAGGSGNCGGFGHPGGVTAARIDDARGLIENNDVFLGGGEGINVLQSSVVVIRGNRVGSLRGATIYNDNTRGGLVVTESNIIWGATDDDIGQGPGTDNGWTGGSATSFNVENNVASTTVNGIGVAGISRNNFGVCLGATMSGSLKPTAQGQGDDIAVRHMGNTVAKICRPGGTTNILDMSSDGLDSTNFGSSACTSLTGSNCEFSVRSSILYAPTTTNSDTCRPEVDNDYNAWGQDSVDTDCQGSNDVNNSDAVDPVFNVASYSDFDAMKWDNQPTWDDARLKSTSTLLGAGDPGLETETCISTSAFDSMISEMTYPFAPTLANWKKCLYYDAEGTVRNATAPNVGALEGSVP